MRAGHDGIFLNREGTKEMNEIPKTVPSLLERVVYNQRKLFDSDKVYESAELIVEIVRRLIDLEAEVARLKEVK